MDEWLEFGSPEGLRFRIRWSEAPIGTVADRTRGELQAWLAETLVWGAHDGGEPVGLDWCWIELLEYLATTWRYLEWEEGNPLGLDVFPDELRSEAEKSWRSVPTSQRNAEERLLFEYLETHNLAASLGGLYAPDLWVVREGVEMRVVGGSRRLTRPLDEVLGALQGLGDEIFSRARSLKQQDERAQHALRGWSDRRKITVDNFISVTTGFPDAYVRRLLGGRASEDLLEVRRDKPQPNELLAAARMMGSGVPVSVLRAVIDRVRRTEFKGTRKLDVFTNAFTKTLGTMKGETPAEQGTALARHLRLELNLGVMPVNPANILETWGVEVVELDFDFAGVDAVCCWGKKHGPVVLLNKSGFHAQGEAGRRATLAHEICHLLVDRLGALPLGEVLGGRLPPLVEPRARAFAAEFLLPGTEARQLATVPPAALGSSVIGMSRRYRVSREIIAWQVRNSGVELSPKHVAYFRGLVSDPFRF